MRVFAGNIAFQRIEEAGAKIVFSAPFRSPGMAPVHAPPTSTAQSEGQSVRPDPRRLNSYDFVRFVAAGCVLFSHHFDLAGLPEPAVPGFGEDFGELGVEIFFCLSGFLICLSLRRSSDWAQFLAAR